MPRMIQCPKCRTQIDVADTQAGSTIRCRGCNSLVRVPSGSYPQVQPAAPAPKRGGPSTALFRKMSGARTPGGPRHTPTVAAAPRARGAAAVQRNNLPILLACIFAGVAVLVAALVILRPKSEEKPKKQTTAPSASTNKYEEPEPDSKPTDKKETKPTKLRKTDEGKYQAPPKFQPGAEAYARRQTKEWPAIAVEAATQSACDELLRKGDLGSIKKEDWRFLPAVLVRLLSDEETIARNAFQALADICEKRKISSAKDGDPFKNPIHMDLVNSEEYRGGDYVFWALWWQHKGNQEAVASWKDVGDLKIGPVDAEKANWPKLIADLRSGGAFDQMDDPSGLAIAQIKAMGRPGIVKLIGFLDTDELQLINSLNSALCYLTGVQRPKYNNGNKGQAKSEWEHWLKTH